VRRDPFAPADDLRKREVTAHASITAQNRRIVIGVAGPMKKVVSRRVSIAKISGANSEESTVVGQFAVAAVSDRRKLLKNRVRR